MTKSRKKYRKNCGPKLVARVKQLTTDLFAGCMDQARSETPFPSDEDLNTSDLVMPDYIERLKIRSSEIYQERIKTLPTKDLEDILWVHENGIYRRAPSTLEGITSELAKRQLFD
jgi:hypothetical protein